MLFCKITFTPPSVLKNPRGILGAISRPLAVPFLPKPLKLTPWRIKSVGYRNIRAFSSSRIIMSSDADYAAFLKKSQKDYSQSYEEDPSKQAATTTASTAQSEVHPAVRALGERFFVSDADEPFEGVSFAWDKGTLPTEGL